MENTSNKKIVILGAGISGLTLAWKLSKIYRDKVVLLEKEGHIGGLCATLSKDGFSFDLGSHRFHDMYMPRAWGMIKTLCGDDILKQKRKGLLYVKGYRMRYPPSALNVIKALGFTKSLHYIFSYLEALILRYCSKSKQANTYELHTIREVGKLAYEKFYKPYAIKLWGISPDKIAMESAIRRVSRFQLAVLWQEFIRKLRGKDVRFFYYPKEGIGYLPHILGRRFLENGGSIHTSVNIEKLEMQDDRINRIYFKKGDASEEVIEVQTVISTIPFEDLSALLYPHSDDGITPMRWRSLRILYLITQEMNPSINDTYYFSDPDLLVGRVSEINKFSPFLNVDNKNHFLTIEVPCSYNDEVWNMQDHLFAQKVIEELMRVGILKENLTNQPVFFSKKLKNLYPVYEIGWKEKFNKIYNRFNLVDNLYLIGRRALFLHCNIDHCMIMADKLAGFLSQEKRDKQQWQEIVNSFYSFQVRD
ncbi:MAG: FAD-dependent oxidoreductase [Candidatus Omnitrophica bacterium]|nr:FAD-dependent oxidoreductase [Candidatus Omnitrophota bacterium]